MKKQQRLILVWLVITLLSFVVNSIGQYPGPVPYTDDACLATCGRCDYRFPQGVLHWYCCM